MGVSAGQSLGLTDAVAPVADIGACIEEEAEVALARLRPGFDRKTRTA